MAKRKKYSQKFEAMKGCKDTFSLYNITAITSRSICCATCHATNCSICPAMCCRIITHQYIRWHFATHPATYRATYCATLCNIPNKKLLQQHYTTGTYLKKCQPGSMNLSCPTLPQSHQLNLHSRLRSQMASPLYNTKYDKITV